MVRCAALRPALAASDAGRDRRELPCRRRDRGAAAGQADLAGALPPLRGGACLHPRRHSHRAHRRRHAIAMQAGDYVCFPGRAEGRALPDQRRACDLPLRDRRREQSERGRGLHRFQQGAGARRWAGARSSTWRRRRGYWDGEDTGLPKGQSPPPRCGSRCPSRRSRPSRRSLSHDVAWEERRGHALRRSLRHLTRAAVGEDYHVGMLIEAPAPGMRLCAAALPHAGGGARPGPRRAGDAAARRRAPRDAGRATMSASRPA